MSHPFSGIHKTVRYKTQRIQEHGGSQHQMKKKEKAFEQKKSPSTILITSEKLAPSNPTRRLMQVDDTTMKASSVSGQKSQNPFKKQKNLKLRDYLRLASLTKKSQSHKKQTSKDSRIQKSIQTSRKRVQKKSPKKETEEKNKAIDTENGIKIIKQQTKNQLNQVGTQLQELLKQINECQLIQGDQQSLVFMCNVLNVFEERICNSVKIANGLLEEHMRKKQITSLKNYANNPRKSTKRRRVEEKNKNSLSVLVSKSRTATNI